jgi:hypothetical protein
MALQFITLSEAVDWRYFCLVQEEELIQMVTDL